jgi:3D (Asp-Asp-Asp) domain-containing protein
MSSAKRRKQLAVTALCLATFASPLLAQCKAKFSAVPVPGSIADAGASCAPAFLIDLGDGTVADRANHLLWAKTPTNPFPCDMTGFISYCAQLNLLLGGDHTWYVPDVAQLQTLLPPGTCQAVMDSCGTGNPDYYWNNGLTWSSSTVTPDSYYCPGYGCPYYGWGVATGLGSNFGSLENVPLLPPRKRVDAMTYDQSCLVRCVADNLKLAITTPDPVTVPAGATLVNAKVLTEEHLALKVTDILPVSGFVLTLRSSRPTVDTIYGPFAPPNPIPATNGSGLTDAYVHTYDQTSASTIDSTTPLIFTSPKGVVNWLPANFVDSFYTTCYDTALESDSTDRFVAATRFPWCFGAPPGRTYRSKFMGQVSVQGSGISVLNEVVQFRNAGGCYYLSGCPTTAIGACAQVGVTAAVDPGDSKHPGVIPLRAAITIDTLGARQAQDTGGGVTGYHLDIYNGAGLAVCRGWPNPALSVTFNNY